MTFELNNSIVFKNITNTFCLSFQELFTVYFRLYLKPSQDINRVLLARIIQAVTKGCCSQTDGLNPKFLDFFSKAIQNARYSNLFLFCFILMIHLILEDCVLDSITKNTNNFLKNWLIVVELVDFKRKY